MRSDRRSTARVRRYTAATIALSLAVLGACGGDDDDADTDAPATTDEPATDDSAVEETATDEPATDDSTVEETATDEPATEATTAPTTEDTSSASDDGGDATGDPVRAMVILDESDAMGLTYTTKRAAMDSMVEEINSTGGLGGSGRPVELEYCVTQFDPNLAQQCARDAVDDDSIVAVVGMITNYPDQVNPILEEAGMASVGTEPYGYADGTSPIAFPITAGFLSSVAGMGTVLADVAGSTKISVIHVDVPSAQASVGTIETALAPRGLDLVNVIAVPIGKADVSAETAAALENSDGLALLTDPATASNVIQAMTQQGNVVAVGAASGQFSAASLEGLGDAGNGLLLSNWFASDDTDAPGVAEFLRIMEQYDTVDNSDDLAKSGYTAMLLLDQAAEGASAIDREGLLTFLGGYSDFDTGGLTPPIDFTVAGPLVIDGQELPRFVNPTITYGKVEDARVTAVDGTFQNPFDAP